MGVVEGWKGHMAGVGDMADVGGKLLGAEVPAKGGHLAQDNV